ncbi:2-amino-4-hydroxy-6-hydroxymethyldihydropteridine diphosphokinase [Corynebacterium breve]|uniref:2-amino-4-hydroxy-6-hydroxymethyldihydropteridine diphosphokinase n=1 Tax=Corynebacterium breve TaxID=3049799 RepID=A0ABY8VE33_9CORY|nr:2-amino-4-hydroxy-6-hydroxymethyldihydropteridine diphosphokinase [Corynebacterium breve]WIM67367.1 2-amino-4-hydroxy-6-hydroxymethyldihydropteridine diphosphokinase [Corynebacterium breve]
MRAVLSIGSNMDDSWAYLDLVAAHFTDELVNASGVYSTPPWGGVEQDDFLNQALIVEVTEGPLELLRRCQALENEASRSREVRWGPRTLDVDIVQLIDDTGAEITSDSEELTLPHPRARERAFVLVPWLDADPHAKLGGEAVVDIVDKLDRDEVEQIRLVER